MGTHESQRDPRETSTEALDYMQHVRVKLAQPNRHADYIINMDQIQFLLLSILKGRWKR